MEKLFNATSVFTGVAGGGISIIENAAEVSTKIPDGLKNILLQLRGDNNDGK